MPQLKRGFTAVFTVFALVSAGCSSTHKAPAATTPLAPLVVPETGRSEQVKAALIEEFDAVRAKLNSANEAAETEYFKAKTAIKKEQIAGFSTDIDARSKAEAKHSENEIQLSKARIKNIKQSLVEHNQIVRKPEYQQVFQELGVSPEVLIDEPTEDTLDRLTAEESTK